MTRSELIEALGKRLPDLPQKDITLAVHCIIDHMYQGLSSGERIEIRGFGSFALRLRPARLGRNPKTGESIALPKKHVPHFKPGRELQKRVTASRDQHKIVA